MHELAVTQSILNIALKHAEKERAHRVSDLYLVIGRLSSIVDDSVQFYWDIVAAGTLCEGSTLHFERIPAQMHCLNCDQDFTLDSELAPCPSCGSMQLQVISGDQFYLDSIEIQTQSGEVIQ